MGHRTIKRVPLDFDWPTGEVWKGYRNPRKPPPECTRCDGSGLNPATLVLDRTFYDNEGFGGRWMYVRTGIVDGRGRPQQVIVGECLRWCHQITVDEVVALAQEGRLTEFTHTWTGRWLAAETLGPEGILVPAVRDRHSTAQPRAPHRPLPVHREDGAGDAAPRR